MKKMARVIVELLIGTSWFWLPILGGYVANGISEILLKIM